MRADELAALLQVAIDVVRKDFGRELEAAKEEAWRERARAGALGDELARALEALQSREALVQCLAGELYQARQELEDCRTEARRLRSHLGLRAAS